MRGQGIVPAISARWKKRRGISMASKP